MDTPSASGTGSESDDFISSMPPRSNSVTPTRFTHTPLGDVFACFSSELPNEDMQHKQTKPVTRSKTQREGSIRGAYVEIENHQ